MKIKLAGINVPLVVLNDLLNELPEEKKEFYKQRLTPIVLASAYAKVSRSTKNITQLVDEAIKDVAKAKESSQVIAFGMGHHSIADHVMFNFNMEKISRLAIEAIEERRIAGYTEKSQRYVTLDGDFLRPKEFSKGDLEKFEKLVSMQNDFYFKYNPIIFEHLKNKNINKIFKLESRELKNFIEKLEGSAKEDARYVLSLATLAQLGCSYTGQTAELAIKKLKYPDLVECGEISELWRKETKKYEEILQLINPETFKKFNQGRELKEDNFKYTKRNLGEITEKAFQDYYANKKEIDFIFNDINDNFSKLEEVIILKDNGSDLNVLTALLHSNSKEKIEDCFKLASYMIFNKDAKEFLQDALHYLSEYDKIPRDFEMTGLIYEMIISASCFAQLKRHRMMTLLSQDYNPELGITIPENIIEVGAADELDKICNESSSLYYEFKHKYGKAAEYCLTNAHRRRILVGMNIRELYHFSRERCASFAQWDIRDKANKMVELAKQVAPITSILLGGKDKFYDIRSKEYGE